MESNIFKENRKEFVDELIKSLENKKMPWEKAWQTGTPINPTTNTPYKGNNNLRLSIEAMKKGFDDNRWLTFNQAKKENWNVKKGEKGTKIEVFKIYDTKTKKDFNIKTIENLTPKEQEIYKEKNTYIMQKHYTVFNAQQIDNIPKLEKNEKIIDYSKINNILTNSNIPIIEGGDKAYYSPQKDEIHLPYAKYFKSENQYYGTALHELSHSTGHELRMNREINNNFGTQKYAKEELKAELSSFFIAQSKGIEYNNIEKNNTIAYMQSWITILKDDPNEFFKAGKEANKIADKILTYETEKQPTLKELQFLKNKTNSIERER